MARPNDRQPASKSDIDKLSKNQGISSIVQIKYWFIALGFTFLGIAVAVVLATAVISRGASDPVIWLFVICFLIIGVFSITYSRQIASDVWRRELRQDGSNMNQIQKRLKVPPALKTLSLVVVYIMLILGCLYLVAGVSYAILSSFHLFALAISATVIAMFFILGIAHLILFYTAMIISGQIE